MRMMELVNCVCNVIRAAYPILKDMFAAIKKADQRGNADRKES